MLDRVNLDEQLARIQASWTPRVVGELNGQQVKLVRFQGEFVWHAHADEDELFLVLKGAFDLQLRDGVIPIAAGEFVVVPRGVEHCPHAAREALVLLFEPATTSRTGDVDTVPRGGTDRTP
jgi:mannose-6-phosphate isomerase-like protein (cupin superfamily)